MNATTTEPTTTAHAQDLARDAHDNNFRSNRGTGPWCVAGAAIGFYVYDNHPPADDWTRRDQQYKELARFLEQRGCRLAACASYPTTGEDAGYTLAFIFVSADPGQANADEVASREFVSGKLLAGPAASAATPVDEAALHQRACSAYARRTEATAAIPQTPSQSLSGFTGDVYELRNARGPLARFTYDATKDRLRAVE